MSKLYLRIVLSLLFTVFPLLSIYAADDHDFVVDGICYSITDLDKKEVEVAPYSRQKGENAHGYSGSVEVPEAISMGPLDFKVTRIGADAFRECNALMEVKLPLSVETIDIDAFSGCTNLRYIHIPEGVKSIGGNAFNGCVSLERVEFALEGVQSIGSAAFSGCVSLKSLTLPNGVHFIGINAFSGCTSLKTIELPSTLETIEECAFSHCYGLQELRLPNSLKRIGMRAFEFCYGLVTVEIPAGLDTLEYGAFAYCLGLQRFLVDPNNSYFLEARGLLVNKEKTAIYASSGEVSGEMVIPNSIEKIYDYAFVGNNRLTNVVFSKNLRHIGKEAFRGCGQLSNFEIPNSVSSIGEDAFADTPWFESQPPYSGVIYAGAVAYGFKGDLPTTLEIKDGTIGIADGAFMNSRLESVTLPGKLLHIGDEAFRGTKLYSIVIPKNVTEIGEKAFAECKSLQIVHCKCSVPPSVQQDTFILTDVEKCTLFVPKKSKESYSSSQVWHDFQIREDEK